MKRLVLTLTLLLLTLTELYLLVQFFPVKWQNAVDAALSSVLPQAHDYSAITHPALDHEVQQALQHSAFLRIAFYGSGCFATVGQHVLVAASMEVLGPDQKIK